MKYIAVVINFFLSGLLCYQLIVTPNLGLVNVLTELVIICILLYTSYVLIRDTSIKHVYISVILNVLAGFALYMPVLVLYIMAQPALESLMLIEGMRSFGHKELSYTVLYIALTIFVPVLVNYTALYQKRNRFLRQTLPAMNT